MKNFLASRILHTMLRVACPKRSLAFYIDILGMSLLRQEEHPEGRYSLFFLGFQPEQESSCLELTHNWDRSEYTLGNAYGHIALEVDDIEAVWCELKSKQVALIREPGSRIGSDEKIAFIEDPDGYRIELIEYAAKTA